MKVSRSRSLWYLSILWCFSLLSAPVWIAGQSDLIPTSDLTGGSSVFVLRRGGLAAKRLANVAVRAERSRAQRQDVAKRIRSQYETIAKAEPTRVRSATVTPDKLPTNIKTLPKDKAAAIFAGVGEYYIDNNGLDEAISYFREALILDPKNSRASGGLSAAAANKGEQLLDRENFAAAKAYFLESIKYDSKNASAYLGLAEVFNEADQRKEAIANYEKALALNPKLTEVLKPLGMLYYENGEIAKADELLTRALAISGESADAQLLLGSIRFAQNRDQEALTAFNAAKRLDPNNAEAWFGSGEVLVRLGRQKDAVNEFTKALAVKPGYFEAWMELASVQYDLKNYQAALDAYKQATRIKNNNAAAAEGAGDAYRMLGDYNAAAGAYQFASSMLGRDGQEMSRDEQAELFSKLGFVIGRQCEINLKRAVACQWESAVAALTKAVELSNGNAADLTNLGWAYYNWARVEQTLNRNADTKDKLTNARNFLERAVAANPNYLEAPLLNLGMVRTDLGDFAGAAEALARVVKKEPKWVFAWNELGIAYRKQNNYKDAIAQFKKAIDLDENYAPAWYNLAESQIRSGDIKEAKKAYQKLKKLGRTDMTNALELMTSGAITK
ncbi:MAG: tetratricopeptide repeat protein [Acidobacteria bacterium]|nr:tetratricopeptide repeat protein [Acidobacteriota bacterium]MCW5948886.1 tetratricopeptide repeat protein [Pyrinomonadaceae bacterium]